jgi:hypothetical protein
MGSTRVGAVGGAIVAVLVLVACNDGPSSGAASPSGTHGVPATTGTATASTSLGGSVGAEPHVTAFDPSGLPTKKLKVLGTADTGFSYVSMIASAGNRIWAASPDGLDVLDPRSGKFSSVAKVPAYGIMGDQAVLVTTAQSRGVLARYDTKTYKRVWEVTRDHPGNVALVGENLWVADYTQGTMSILDVKSGRETGKVTISAPDPQGPSEPERVGGSVWVRVESTHEVVGVDVATRTVRSRVRLPAAMKLCGKHVAVVGEDLWVPDCSTLLGRIDTTTGKATFLDVGASPGPPVRLGGQVWVPVGDHLVHVTSSGTMDRALTVPGAEEIFEVEVADGQVWASVGAGKLAHLPAPQTW